MPDLFSFYKGYEHLKAKLTFFSLFPFFIEPFPNFVVLFVVTLLSGVVAVLTLLSIVALVILLSVVTLLSVVRWLHCYLLSGGHIVITVKSHCYVL